MLEQALKKVAVIGAGGKMGSGIAALMLQEMTRCEAERLGCVGTGEYSLTLVDLNTLAFPILRAFLREQLKRYAEKKINMLRESFARRNDLVSNGEMIDHFVEGALDNVRFERELLSAKDSALVFEAIFEDVAAKTALYNNLKANACKEQYYFSNTSAIPISILDRLCNLEQRIIGFHFYNPPVQQKLVEIVIPQGVSEELNLAALDLAERLDKVVVQARDVPGFIGNGYLIREIRYACECARYLMREHHFSFSQALICINILTQRYLIRPMGIFQLIDYIGLDVIEKITEVMSLYLEDPSLRDPWITQLAQEGVKGGETLTGSQKPGCFQYERKTPTHVYSLQEKSYFPIAELLPSIEEWLGPTPIPIPSWKTLSTAADNEGWLHNYFKQLAQSDTPGSTLAKALLAESSKIAELLVRTKTAQNMADVDQVLKKGFFHLYTHNGSK